MSVAERRTRARSLSPSAYLIYIRIYSLLIAKLAKGVDLDAKSSLNRSLG
ncbi:predicted protein [Plenodomus lingam JN3]|uniref:Predicted protein n=1 Tax=Leptosphaeria maculans (strain JN3 / isolate v23.1.3 / race Av1-4-5-6-7-8) TaxID=985895 RepID=E5R4C9_LEPMJ|nr:predicted protein [Plenodomus lingam JN3]CBX91897.1 predicted protein [Plenodomus lingam JN3]